MIKSRMQHLALIIALVLAALLVHAYPDDPYNTGGSHLRPDNRCAVLQSLTKP